MATLTTLLRAVRKVSLASRAAAMASCGSARAAGVAAAASLGPEVLDPLKSLRPQQMSARADDVFPTIADYPHLPDDAKYPTDKDMESDEGVWALYERWCKAFRKQRDHAEMARRFKIFRYYARYVHEWNTYVPDDPEEAAIRLEKRREATLLLSKGEDVSDIDELHVPYALGRLDRKEREACSAVKDVIVEE